MSWRTVLLSLATLFIKHKLVKKHDMWESHTVIVTKWPQRNIDSVYLGNWLVPRWVKTIGFWPSTQFFTYSIRLRNILIRIKSISSNILIEIKSIHPVLHIFNTAEEYFDRNQKLQQSCSKPDACPCFQEQAASHLCDNLVPDVGLRKVKNVRDDKNTITDGDGTATYSKAIII